MPQQLGGPEVNHLDMSVGGEQHVLGLDIAVDDIALVEELQDLEHLRRVEGRRHQRQPTTMGQLPQLAAGHQLQREVQGLHFLEGVIHVDDGGMAHVAQHPALDEHLVLLFVALHLRLVNHLDCDTHLCRPQCRRNHLRIVALAEQEIHVEVGRRELRIVGPFLRLALQKAPLPVADGAFRPRLGRHERAQHGDSP